jgi:hypothetical protein
LVKANLTKNFGLEIKNQYTTFSSLIDSIKPINFTNSIESTNFISSTGNISATEFIKNTIITKKSILEDITHKLLENKHTLTLGHHLEIIPNLRQYIATKLAPEKKLSPRQDLIRLLHRWQLILTWL